MGKDELTYGARKVDAFCPTTSLYHPNPRVCSMCFGFCGRPVREPEHDPKMNNAFMRAIEGLKK